MIDWNGATKESSIIITAFTTSAIFVSPFDKLLLLPGVVY